MVVVTDIAGRLDGVYWPQGQLEGGGWDAEYGIMLHKNGTTVEKFGNFWQI